MDKSRRGARKKSLQVDQRLEHTLDWTGVYRLALLFNFQRVPSLWKRYRFTFFTNIIRIFKPMRLYEEDTILRNIVRRKDLADEVQAFSLLTSTSSTTPRSYLRPCSLLQWAHDNAGQFPIWYNSFESVYLRGRRNDRRRNSGRRSYRGCFRCPEPSREFPGRSSLTSRAQEP